MPTASLDFTVRLVRDEQSLHEVCAVRAQSYGHHVPDLQDSLMAPDATDRMPGTVVLVARDKASGRAVGTARIQRNHPQALAIEASVTLPPEIAAQTRAEITRLAIMPGADSLVRPMLVKACYLYAVAAQIRWLVIGARSDALIRIYRSLGFADLLPGQGRVPLAHAGGLPHLVLGFDVVAAERTWHQLQHSLYPFMVETWHPDLQLVADAPMDSPPAEAAPVWRAQPMLRQAA